MNAWNPLILLRAIALFLVCFISLPSQGQMTYGGTPKSETHHLEPIETVPVITMPSIDLEALEAEDEQDRLSKLPMRFGFPFKASIDLQNNGNWENIPEGRIWRMRIACPGARTINLNYDDFHMPQGGTFFIYSTDKKHSIGAFTEINNKKHRTFATGLVPADEIILEYFEPTEQMGKGSISISDVIHGYRNLNSMFQEKGFDDSESCNVNVNCEIGDDWQEIKKSVAMMTTAGNFRFCSGALVNNPEGNCDPLFLTAFHCTEAQSPGDNVNWIFIFNYESADCENPDDEPSLIQNVQGAEVLAMGFHSDFTLLQLDENPALAPNITDGVFYAGWNRAATLQGETVSIHHPTGDIKKISYDSGNPAGNSTWHNEFPNTHWRVTWNSGITAEGSSGGPLFDNEGNIIGQLHGGGSFCSNPTAPDLYGKVSHSWTSNGPQPEEQLAPWLDPDGSDIAQMDGRPCGGYATDVGIKILSPIGNYCDGLITPLARITNNGYNTINLVGVESFLDGGASEVDVHTGSIEPFSHVDVSLKSRINTSGNHVISACFVNINGNPEDEEISNNCTSVSINCTEVGIDDPRQNGITTYPNPTTGVFYLEGLAGRDVRSIELINAKGQFSPLSLNKSNGSVEIPVDFSNGIYFVQIKMDGQSSIQKVQLIR